MEPATSTAGRHDEVATVGTVGTVAAPGPRATRVIQVRVGSYGSVVIPGVTLTLEVNPIGVELVT